MAKYSKYNLAIWSHCGRGPKETEKVSFVTKQNLKVLQRYPPCIYLNIGTSKTSLNLIQA